MAWLGTWAKRRKITVDNTNIDSDLTHFPVAIVLGTSVGQSSQDISDIFDELEYTGSVDDDFTGTDADPPDADLWALTGAPDIQSNQLHCSTNNDVEQITANFQFSGDFDVQIDFDDFTFVSGDTSFRMKMTSAVDPDYYMYLVRQKTSANSYVYTEQKTGGSASAENVTTKTETSGKFRITRSGTTIATYYDFDGGGWDSSKSTGSTGFAGDFILAFSCESITGVASLDYDNFTVNSGAIVWPASTNPNRKKIAITKADGTTQMYGDMELWDDDNEKAVIWVSKSDLVLSSTGTTDLYIYFDSAQSDNTTYISASGGTAAQSVYDSDFAAVYHMSQDPSGGTDAVKDSTSNNNDATSDGSMTSGDLVDGLIGKAIDLDGTDDWLDVGDTTSMDGATAATFEFAGKIATLATSAVFARKWASGQQAFIFGLHDTTSSEIQMLINDATPANVLAAKTTNASLAINTDYVLAFSWGGTNVVSAYKEGTALTTSLDIDNNQVSIPNVTERLGLGAEYDAGTPTNFLDGAPREIRLSTTARSAAWLKATSYTLKDDLIIFSAAESITATVDIGAAEMTMTASIDDPLTATTVDIGAAEMTMTASIDDPLTATIAVLTAAEMTMTAGIDDPLTTTIAVLTAAEMTMTARVGVKETASLTAAEMTMTASISGVSLQVPMPAAEMTMTGALGDVLIFDHALADVYYIFTLTGAADSLADIEIPMSSFQTRMRDGDPTFLSVVIPDNTQAAAITARSNGTLKVDMAYKLNDAFIQRETIVSADLETVRIDEGITSAPITLSGHKTESYSGAAITLATSTYRNIIDGKIRHRLAEPNISLRPGDTVTIGSDVFVVGLLTYYMSVKSKTMEISEA